ncbi:MAG: MFS transporter, partial [Clostridia bacterium]|nr:MFS transporter [Clostridia bacterium]
KRLGARRMVGCGFGFLITSMLIYSLAQTYWQFYIGGIFLGAGFAWTTTTIVGHIVGNWFTNRRGSVMGVILAANGLGGALSEQIVTRVIYGLHADLPAGEARWRLAYQLTALLFLAVAIPVVAVLRNRPADIGLEPLGQDEEQKKKRGADWDGLEMAAILRKPYFYLSGICVFAAGFILQAMVNVAKPHMYDLGIPRDYVIMVFSVHALVLFAAKILVGVSYDRFGMRLTYAACSVAALISLACLSAAHADSDIGLWVYSILSSLALPIETVVVPLLVSELFGRRAHSTIMGYYTSLNVLGYACGVPLANLAYDLTGSYRGILIALTVTMALTAVFSLLSLQMARRDRLALESAQ